MNNPSASPESDVVMVTEQSEGSELASRLHRANAVIIDGFLLLFLLAPVMYFMGLWDYAAKGQTAQFLTTLLSAALGFLIYALLNGNYLAKYGQTIGKRAMKIKIINLEGNQISLTKILFARQLPMSLFGLIPIVGGSITSLDALFILRKNRRCLHDLIAGTKVVNVEPINKARGAFWIMLIFIGLFILVIIAAAIPAYQDYIKRAKQAELGQKPGEQPAKSATPTPAPRPEAQSPTQQPPQQPIQQTPQQPPLPQKEALPASVGMPKTAPAVAAAVSVPVPVPSPQAAIKPPENSAKNFSSPPALAPNKLEPKPKPAPENVVSKRALDQEKRRVAEQQALEQKLLREKQTIKCVIKPVMTDEDIERCRRAGR